MIVSYDIQQFAELVGGEILGSPKTNIKILSTDSRSIPHSEGVMFVAIRGDRHNGNDYIGDVYKKGISTFLVDIKPDLRKYPGAVFCLVKDSLKALHEIAMVIRGNFEGTVIGITGSNGKTIVKEWLYQMLQYDRNVIRSPRSYNSQLGVPLSIWPVNNLYDFAVIEAGISMTGEMEKLEKMITPQLGILTNLGSAHSENFSSESEKLEEKLKLFSGSGKIIYRTDLEVDGKNINEFLKDYDAEKIGWSLKGEGKYSFSHSEAIDGMLKLNLAYGSDRLQFAIQYTDEASIENICHVIVCMLELGLDRDSIINNISRLEPVEMRLQILKGIHGTTLINDVYNSDLAGLNSAVDVLMQQKNHVRNAVILSDVFQSGLDDEELYKEVSDLVKFLKIDMFIGVGKAISNYQNLFPEGSKFFPDTSSFLLDFNFSEISNYAVLIKGARSFQFERITKELQFQVHQTVLEIDVNALIDNLNYYRSVLSPETKIMVMVKALSYGSGSYEIAGLLQHQQVDYLAVAFSDEGINLRNAGVNLPVMVMNAAIADYQQLIDNDLEPVIFSIEGLEKFKDLCSFNGKVNYSIHLKLDTGMHRLGFRKNDIVGLCDKLIAKEINVRSIFSHLAGSDEERLDEFSREQVAVFMDIYDRIIEGLSYPVMKHILNSAGAERFPEYHMDMVRIGIGLYGQGISKNLKPVSTFKTVISQIQEVKKDETVGYSRSGKLDRDSKIAIIPVGYADGINRRLGNGNISFYVNGKPAPTVGNICMDMCMIDVTAIDATVGDIVELFGKGSSVSVIADKLGTITYEVLTSIPERVKRVYIRR